MIACADVGLDPGTWTQFTSGLWHIWQDCAQAEYVRMLPLTCTGDSMASKHAAVLNVIHTAFMIWRLSPARAAQRLRTASASLNRCAEG